MKDRFSKLTGLSSDLAIFAKRELSSARNGVDKTITSAIEIGKTTKDTIISGVNKSGDLIQSAADTEQAKSFVDAAKNIANTAAEQATKYADQLTALTTKKVSLTSEPTNKAHELKHVIEKLKGKDKFGLFGEGLAVTGGGAAGVAAASTLASAAGASTLLGSTSLASVLGGTFVAATPVGWIIGSAVVAGAAGYGIAKLVRSGSKQDQVREQLIKRFESRLAALSKYEIQDFPLEELNQLLPIVIGKGLISAEQAERMVGLIESGSLKAEIALQRLKSMSQAYVL